MSQETKFPAPWVLEMKPMRLRVRRASRTEFRPTPSFSASSRSGGSFSPCFRLPLRISVLI